jgi:hypothetical protein
MSHVTSNTGGPPKYAPVRENASSDSSAESKHQSVLPVARRAPGVFSSKRDSGIVVGGNLRALAEHGGGKIRE